MQEVMGGGEPECVPGVGTNEVAPRTNPQPLHLAKTQPQPTHDHSGGQGGDKARHDHHRFAGEGNEGREEHDGIDSRGGQEEGQRRRRSDAARHQAIGHRHGGAFAAGEDHSRGTGHRHRKNGVLRQRLLPKGRRDEGCDRSREHDSKNKEGQGLHHDGNKDRGTRLQRGIVKGIHEPALPDDEQNEAHSQHLKTARPIALALGRRTGHGSSTGLGAAPPYRRLREA